MKNFHLPHLFIVIFLLIAGFSVKSGQKLNNFPDNSVTGYITSNQYDINILSYDLSVDLYPEKKLLKGNATITGIITNKNVTSLDLNFYDNLKISGATINGNPASYKRTSTNISFLFSEVIKDTFKLNLVRILVIL